MQVLSCEVCKIFQKSFSIEHLCATTSIDTKIWNVTSIKNGRIHEKRFPILKIFHFSTPNNSSSYKDQNKLIYFSTYIPHRKFSNQRNKIMLGLNCVIVQNQITQKTINSKEKRKRHTMERKEKQCKLKMCPQTGGIFKTL